LFAKYPNLRFAEGFEPRDVGLFTRGPEKLLLDLNP
jgi:hypothetical protein